MDRRILKRLTDINNAIEEINNFVKEKGRRYDVYITDRMFYKAVNMNLAIIGEALNNILKEKPDIEITSAKKIVATRNYIIHGYDSLSNEILWNIIINHLPILDNEIKKLIKKYS